MAAGLTKDPILILRIDGEDLKEFICSVQFEQEVIAILPRVESANASLHRCLTIALEQLTIDHGMPPSSDSWVFDNVIGPAVQSLSMDQLEQPFSQEIFLRIFKKLVEDIIQRLKEHPVIVARSESIFSGSGIRRLLSNKFELNKLLDVVWRDLQKDQNCKASKELFELALNGMATSADLPPYGTVNQVDAILSEVIRMVNADCGKIIQEEEFKRTMSEILESVMLQLDDSPISISSSSVIHQPMASSTLLDPSSSSAVSFQKDRTDEGADGDIDGVIKDYFSNSCSS